MSREKRPLVEKGEIGMRRSSREIQSTSGVVKKWGSSRREVVRN